MLLPNTRKIFVQNRLFFCGAFLGLMGGYYDPPLGAECR